MHQVEGEIIKTYQFIHTGAYHRSRNEAGQDAVFCGENERWCVITLADGVSTCENAGAGARVVCEELTAILLEHAELFANMDKNRAARLIWQRLTHVLWRQARAEGQAAWSYASTLSAVLYDHLRRELLLFSIGDSLILGMNGPAIRILCPPETPTATGGCNTTTTQGKEYVTVLKKLDAAQMKYVAVFSDGAWSALMEGQRLQQGARAVLAEPDFAGLAQCLQQENNKDDCSFIALELTQGGVFP